MVDLVKTRAQLDASPNPYGIIFTGDDAADAALMNDKVIDQKRDLMTASEVLNARDDAEYGNLSAADQAEFWRVLGIGGLNPFGTEATIVAGLFGPTSNTITALKAARVIKVSLAEKEGLLGNSREMGHAHIAAARAL